MVPDGYLCIRLDLVEFDWVWLGLVGSAWNPVGLQKGPVEFGWVQLGLAGSAWNPVGFVCIFYSLFHEIPEWGGKQV